MKDNHDFSPAYEKRKQTLLRALRREEALAADRRAHSVSRLPRRILAFAALAAVLTASVYGAVRYIEFRMEQNGNEVSVHAALNDPNGNAGTRPLRSWRSADGEVSIRLRIPDLPADLSESDTSAGKYVGADGTRALTVSGIDLRRSELHQLISGTATELRTAYGKTVYVVSRGEANLFREAFIVYEEEELVLQFWVGCGITDDELTVLASTLTIEETADTALALPIRNEVDDVSSASAPDEWTIGSDLICEADLLEIGGSARDVLDRYTAAVSGVSVGDNLRALRADCLLDKDYVGQFADANGDLIPYVRTEVLYGKTESGMYTASFGESVNAKKQLVVVTLDLSDVGMDELSDADRDEMLRACVNGFRLCGYTVENGAIMPDITVTVIDRTPGAYAGRTEPVYREELGGGRWRIAFLIDEDAAEENLLLYIPTGKIAVRIR